MSAALLAVGATRGAAPPHRLARLRRAVIGRARGEGLADGVGAHPFEPATAQPASRPLA